MIRMIQWALVALILGAILSTEASANTITAADCNTSSVQTAINSAAEGDTILIPACPSGVSWTSGVTISGKGIIVQAAGSGRIVAVSSTTQSLTTGTKTFTVIGADPGTTFSIAPGTPVNITETGFRSNAMVATVSSYSSGTLVVSVSSATGTCGASSATAKSSCGRWLISTLPQTVFINNSSTTLFSVTEDSTVHTRLGGFKIAEGTGSGDGIDFIAGGGQAIILHDCWIEQGGGDSVHTAVNRGLITGCSFDSTPFSMTPYAVHPQPYDQSAWSTPSYFGTNDPDGQHNFYVEDCDFHAYLNAMDNDEGARSVWRYSMFDNAGFVTHGVDTGPFGSRYFEYYNNVGVFEGYNTAGCGNFSTCETFPMNWWFFIRGGTFAIHHNTLPDLVSTDYGTNLTANMTVMNLQRNSAPLPCWGAGSTTGQYYPAPHQVGLGYVTGTGTANYPPDGVTNSSTYAPGFGYPNPQYVGDSEPGYFWANSTVPLDNVSTTDYGGTACTNPDTSRNYIVSGRDYFNGTTAKPGYTPYTYPHPLTAGQGSGSSPAAPTNLTVVVQ